MKPTVFVGSSSEGKKVANKLIAMLEPVASCTLWSETFAINTSAYDSLLSQLAFFDYAILVATADDITISRLKRTATARDNVLFEIGLFAGGIGKKRVFFVADQAIKVPSDWNGITLPMFDGSTPSALQRTLVASSKQITAYIKSTQDSFDFGFLPSAALAYGYFTNFVERTVTRLLTDKAQGHLHIISGKPFKIKELKFSILVPNDLSADMFKKVQAKRLKDGWAKLRVDPKDVRDYDFSVDVSKTKSGILHLVDIPLTLNALNKSIEFFTKKEHIKKSIKEDVVEQREIKNFVSTLKYLIAQSALTRDIVSVELVDV